MEIKKILVPMGGSQYAYNALEYAIQLARHFHSSITGLYVQDFNYAEGFFLNIANFVEFTPEYEWKVKLEKYFKDKADGLLTTFDTRCGGQNVLHEFVTDRGDISELILKHSGDFDLVCMGKKGEHASLLGKFLGSSCARTLNIIEKPVLVVDGQEMQDIRKVLLILVEGQFDPVALDFSVSVCRALDAPLSCLTLKRKKSTKNVTQKYAREYIESKGMNARYIKSSLESEEKILELIRSEECNLITISSIMAEGYEHFIGKCVAGRILTETSIPVLNVK
jgi:nucleotide-binding universal stress UspA family protein